LIVVLQQEPNQTFTRSQDDLYITHSINITEALCGFKTVIKHLDGRNLVLNQKPGEFLAPGTTKAIEKEGMPRHKTPFEKGNLYIKLDVVFPEENSLSDQQIEVK